VTASSIGLDYEKPPRGKYRVKGHRRKAMNETIRALMLAACLTGIVTRAQAGDKKDPLLANTVWTGEIRQGTDAFPTTIYIQARDKDRVRGEIHFKIDGALNKLTFQGNVIGGHSFAWITDKKEGSVTYPGLYTGTINKDALSGTWQVPSAGQYDTFAVKMRK
jgi:hypothetical protein